jgi:ABC-type dipeptide/oligopeptide/nickel transport system permease component
MEEIQKHEMEDLRQEIMELKEIVKPIAESYQAAVKLGTWATKLVVLISVGIGIYASIKGIFIKP